MILKLNIDVDEEITVSNVRELIELKASGKLNEKSAYYDRAKNEWIIIDLSDFYKVVERLKQQPQLALNEQESNAVIWSKFILMLLLGGTFIFITMNFFSWLFFRYTSYVYAFPIILLFPGWAVPLGKALRENLLLVWLIVVVLISAVIVIFAHYGIGAGDLGPGPV